MFAAVFVFELDCFLLAIAMLCGTMIVMAYDMLQNVNHRNNEFQIDTFSNMIWCVGNVDVIDFRIINTMRLVPSANEVFLSTHNLVDNGHILKQSPCTTVRLSRSITFLMMTKFGSLHFNYLEQ